MDDADQWVKKDISYLFGFYSSERLTNGDSNLDTSMSITPNETVGELYSWAQRKLDQPIMLDYILQKVNAQTPDTLLMLLRQPLSLAPNVEVEIIYYPNRADKYWAIFSPLPFHINVPRPELLRTQFQNQQEVIQWLQTGSQRKQLYSF